MFSVVQPETNLCVRYRDSAFADRGVPPVVNGALELLLALDADQSPEQISKRAIKFLKELQPYFADPESELLKVFLIESVKAKFRSGGLERAIHEKFPDPPKIIPEEMFARLEVSISGYKYRAINSKPELSNKWRASFASDLSIRTQQLYEGLEATCRYSRAESDIFCNTAAIVLNFFERVVGEKKILQVEPALELAEMIGRCAGPRDLALCLVTAELAQSSGLTLAKAANVMQRRFERLGIVLSADELAKFSEWTRAAADFELTSIDDANRVMLHQQLLKAMRATAGSEYLKRFETSWLSSIEPKLQKGQYHVRAQSPEVVKSLALNARIGVAESEDLLAAARLLTNKELTGGTISIDYSLFAWPRLAESVLVADPHYIRINYPFRARSEASDGIEGLEVRSFCLRERHVLPNLLLCGDPWKVIERDLALIKHGSVTIGADDTGCFLSEGRKTFLEIKNNNPVRRRIASILKMSNFRSPSFIIESVCQEKPRAFAVLFEEMLREAPGYERITFGKTLSLYIANEPMAGPEVEPTIEKIEAPARQGRPRLSEAQRSLLRTFPVAIKEVQRVAATSNLERVTIPFDDGQISAILQVLFKGEKPGGKQLKRLRSYLLDDNNFSGCRFEAVQLRTELIRIVDDLI